MKRYPEYKESSVEWIGEIPAHWEIGKIKHIATFVSEKSTSETDAIKISPENVESETGKVLDFYSPYDSTGVKFQTGDVLFNKLRVYLSKVVFAEYGGYSLGEMIVIRPSLQDAGKYLFYLMLSCRFIEYCNSISYGAKMPRTDIGDILNTQIPMASYQEQHQIANFLDHKTGQIDKLIRTKERRIELLQEQRTVLINQAVTNGLDPTVEMKPSGVEWIGEIPKHWTVTRLKYLGESIIGLSYKPEDVTDDKNGTLVLRASNIQNGKPSFHDNVYVNIEIGEKLRLKEGDILICSRSGSRELIGKNMTITKTLERVTFGVFMTIFRTKSIRFISYFLNSQVFKNQSGLFLTSTINQLTLNTLNNFLISFPTNEREQVQIADFLDHKTQQIDKLIAAEGRKIELLREYRQSLISEVVTGKIDVRSEV